MPKYSKYGERIFDAKEVSAYTVCPESWNLIYLQEKVKIPESDLKEVQQKITWKSDFNATRYLVWAKMVVIFMIFLVVTVYLYTEVFIR